MLVFSLEICTKSYKFSAYFDVQNTTKRFVLVQISPHILPNQWFEFKFFEGKFNNFYSKFAFSSALQMAIRKNGNNNEDI